MPEAGPATACSRDVLIVGGGINGAGIARDLAGRGATVMLVERDGPAASGAPLGATIIAA